jgi:hypothetical protein
MTVLYVWGKDVSAGGQEKVIIKPVFANEQDISCGMWRMLSPIARERRMYYAYLSCVIFDAQKVLRAFHMFFVLDMHACLGATLRISRRYEAEQLAPYVERVQSIVQRCIDVFSTWLSLKSLSYSWSLNRFRCLVAVLRQLQPFPLRCTVTLSLGYEHHSGVPEQDIVYPGLTESL